MIIEIKDNSTEKWYGINTSEISSWRQDKIDPCILIIQFKTGNYFHIYFSLDVFSDLLRRKLDWNEYKECFKYIME